MSINSLISELKNENQDFEFYPTTNEIIDALASDILKSATYYNEYRSVLDVGSGNGKVLKAIKEKTDKCFDLYGIEKSKILIHNTPNDIYIIGTDFYQQSLIDKDIDITFCNPPYKEYEEWVSKIIKESNSKKLYFVIPSRFVNSDLINQALKYRNVDYKVIDSFSFEDSEDRKARAKVDLISINLEETTSAFDSLFNEQFKEVIVKFKEDKKDSHSEVFNKLVTGESLIKSLVEIYNNELNKIKSNYDAVSKLDVSLLKEFNIDIHSIKDLLYQKLKNLKNIYWKEVLSRLSDITDRLTSKNRDSLFKKMNNNGSIDFTESNIYTVIIWIIKNSKDLIDSQMIEVYEKAINDANVKKYKSNDRVFSCDRFRYQDEKPSHIYLDYRIVLDRCGGLKKDTWSRSVEYTLTDYGCYYIQDLLTVANNLGFTCNTVDERLRPYNKNLWYPAKYQEFECIYNGKKEVLFEVKAHLNGNIHLRANQKFMLAMNVEYGRLKGWLHSKNDADNEIMENAGNYFESMFNPMNNNLLLK